MLAAKGALSPQKQLYKTALKQKPGSLSCAMVQTCSTEAKWRTAPPPTGRDPHDAHPSAVRERGLIHVGFQSRGRSVVAAAAATADAVTGVDRQQPLVRRRASAPSAFIWLDPLAPLALHFLFTFWGPRAGVEEKARAVDACGTRTRPRHLSVSYL